MVCNGDIMTQDDLDRLDDEGLRIAGSDEPGWYWRCSDGRNVWVTDDVKSW